MCHDTKSIFNSFDKLNKTVGNYTDPTAWLCMKYVHGLQSTQDLHRVGYELTTIQVYFSRYSQRSKLVI